VVPTTLRVNGVYHTLNVASGERLAHTLRDRLGLQGTKVACGMGECGACTVLVDRQPVLSCLVLTIRATDVETIEGLEDETSALREAFAEVGGYQCGYCTPGQIVTGFSLLREGLPETDMQLRRALSGNICRCTGYQAIVAALRRAEPAEETT
jgi:aerobic-type carbon monoxide dehydrogenase small subunit (CoxS/CutS family)